MKPSLVVVGLGNPGKEYLATRHNAGFTALNALSEAFGEGEWSEKQKFSASICEARIGVVPVLLVKPNTYMNLSGNAVRSIVDFYKLNPSEQILIVSDDIDIPLGEIRLRRTGGPGTHNGLKSIADIYGEEFPRLRVGIGPAPAEQDLSAWVLSALSKGEKETLEDVYVSLPNVVQEFVLGNA